MVKKVKEIIEIPQDSEEKQLTEKNTPKKHITDEEYRNLRKAWLGNAEFQDAIKEVMQKTTVLVAGPAGSGKSLFCMQYLIDRIRFDNVPGVYISFEESWTNLIKDFKSFDPWNVCDLLNKEKKGRLLIIDTVTKNPPAKDLEESNEDIKSLSKYNIEFINIDTIKTESFDSLMTTIQSAVLRFANKFEDEREVKANVVIDSITALLSLEALGDENKVLPETRVRKTMLMIKNNFEPQGLVTFFPAEADKEGTPKFKNEDFIARGVFEMNYEEKSGEYIKFFRIKKLRGAKFSTKKYLVTIEKETGLTISGELI